MAQREPKSGGGGLPSTQGTHCAHWTEDRWESNFWPDLHLFSSVNVTSHDSGTYICRLENGLGEGLEVQTVLEVREERPATVVHAPSTVVLVQGVEGKVFRYLFDCLQDLLVLPKKGKTCAKYLFTSFDMNQATVSSLGGDLVVFCSPPPPLLLFLRAQTFSLVSSVELCCCANLSSCQVLSLKSFPPRLRLLVGRWMWEASYQWGSSLRKLVVKWNWVQVAQPQLLYRLAERERQVRKRPSWGQNTPTAVCAGIPCDLMIRA